MIRSLPRSAFIKPQIPDWLLPRRFDRPWEPKAFFRGDPNCDCNCAPCPCVSGIYYKFTFPTRTNVVGDGYVDVSFASSDTYTIPANAKFPIEVVCKAGGGGGGGGIAGVGGNGGGGAEYVLSQYSGAAGDVLTITINTAGSALGGIAGGVMGANGTDGSQASVSQGVTIVAVANGGKGGIGSGNTYLNGGKGGTGGFGTIDHPGTDGQLNVGAAGGTHGNVGGGDGGAALANGKDGDPAGVDISFHTGNCPDCPALSGLVIGLSPVASSCSWKQCIELADPACGGEVPVVASLSLVGSTMELCITIKYPDGGTDVALWSLASASWNCNGSNSMAFVSATGGHCTWPTSNITVSATDSSVCVSNYYGSGSSRRSGGGGSGGPIVNVCNCLLPSIFFATLTRIGQTCNHNDQCTPTVVDITLNVQGGTAYSGFVSVAAPNIASACEFRVGISCRQFTDGIIEWNAGLTINFDVRNTDNFFANWRSTLPYLTSPPCTPFNGSWTLVNDGLTGECLGTGWMLTVTE